MYNAGNQESNGWQERNKLLLKCIQLLYLILKTVKMAAGVILCWRYFKLILLKSFN